jgi:serine-type D-Ala-D-Ala carboxypeptidase (penicillin-binding protein 5/6)
VRGNLSTRGAGRRRGRRDVGLTAYGGGRRPMILGDVSSRSRGRLPWGKVAAAVVVLLVAAAVQFVRPLPDVRAATAAGASFSTRGSAPALPWPARGSAAVGVSGLGMLGESDPNVTPRPIASVAKIMTAVIVLDAKPLLPGQQGPAIDVTDADVASYQRREAEGESTVKVAPGESLSERQALEGLLVPSGNNISELLARWVAGSPEAFVQQMNAKAAALGLDKTTFDDVSGLSTGTTSIPRDLLKLGMAAMANPVFAEIVAQPQAELPVAGVVYNVDYALGQEGIVGVKTGSSSGAGACFVFAATHQVEGRPVVIYGAVMGLPTLEDAFNATKALIRSVKPGLVVHPLIGAGQKVARYEAPWGAKVDVVTTKEVVAVGWPGLEVQTKVEARPVKGPLAAGAKVGSVTVGFGGTTQTSPLVTSDPLPSPGRGWRLFRMF